MKTDEHFRANYAIIADAELPPSGGPVTNFKYGSSSPVATGIDGPLMRIEPSSGSPWLACFARGYRDSSVVSTVLATPNPDVVCVVCDGAAYWVDTMRRMKQDVRAFPVRQIKVMDDLLVFADFTKLAAYGRDGLVWVSGHLVSDGLTLREHVIAGDILTCSGFNAPAASQVEIKVNVRTGQVVSG